ncbi:MAG: ABC transporter ATP-binding protein [Deltaproteobacteria bacterium]|nr:ABC transporter ATP-binding protein [Deltaproteobacteria bacterium]
MSLPSHSTSAGEPDAVRLVGICKRFGQLEANRDVDLTVRPRSVHALVGENGAGKSTLMKILAGVLRPDAGAIWLGGELVRRLDAREAIARGIGMVHQHFMLVEPLSVAENVVLGREQLRRGLLDQGAAARAVEGLGETYGLRVDPRARVADLSVGERQKVEILKVLFRGARVLVLDEPTAVLAPAEVEGLFRMLRRLVAQERTAILITHKLDEVMAISERVTVMRGGRSVGELATAETSARELAHAMVGREVCLDRSGERREVRAAGAAGPVLELRDLVVQARGVRVLDRVSLGVRAGEILGIAAVQGNGQSELLAAVAGLVPVRSGAVLLAGADVTRLSPRERFASGLAHIPEDRQERGLVLDFSVAENLVLGRQRDYGGRFGLDLRRIARSARKLAARYDIRPPQPAAPAGSLSGGNQQKVVVAREMARRPRVLLAGQPTRGVDVGAVEAIHAHIRAARDAGLGVLLVSADLGELCALSDRIAVLYRGSVAAVLPAEQASAAALGELMLGADPGGAQAPAAGAAS